jgi:septum formation protein
LTRLVLGSASPGRRKVLRQAGLDPAVVVSGVDEDLIAAGLAADASPDDVVCALAAAKADDVAGRLDGATAADCVVLGCDSMLDVDGRLCGKPGTADAAVDQWRLMGGRSGRLHTGHCLLRLIDGAVTQREVESACTTVRFAAPSDADL